MKNEVSIKYIWGIEDKEKWVSLTGSSTLVTVDLGDSKVKILTDIGMFQWWKKDDDLNKEIDEQAIKADYVIITHSHMDHIWRLPMLVKKWFKGSIIMTAITKDLAVHMLNDYVTLTKNKIEEQEEWKKRKWQQLREYLAAIKIHEELKANHLKKEEKQPKQAALNKLKWKTVSIDDYISYATSQLNKYDVLKESDISTAIAGQEIELLYDETDILQTMSMITTLEEGDERDLDTRIIISSLNDEMIDKIPELIKSGYNKKIYLSPHLKNLIIAKWKEVLDNISKENKENKNLRERLFEALNFVNSKENKYSEFLEENKEFLKKHNISKKSDIDELRESCLLFPYSKEEIVKFSSFLEPVFTKNNQKVVESFKLRFFNAGHIEGSVQAIVTIVTKKVDHTLNQSSFMWEYKKEHTNFLLTWDLGKFTDPNISGIPSIPTYKMDYVQIESTYADRNHPNKKEEFAKLIHEINSTEGKTLIAAFSLQRSQEILLELIENKEKFKDFYPQFKVLKKWLKFYKDRFIELEKIDNPTEIEMSEKISLATIINTINEEISFIQKTLFTGNIVLDSPLVVRINKVFQKHLGDKYSLLNPEVQKEIFTKELIRYLDRGEYKDLYTAERIRSKETIISSGWMLQGWSIVNHLKHIIEDPKSKLIFTGYQWEWTLWSEILSGKKQVIIEDKVYDVRCQVVQIKWYSSHIWKDDIIDYTAKKLTYSKKAKLALTHGTELREWLAVEIRDAMKKVWKKVDLLIPKLWDEIKIKI